MDAPRGLSREDGPSVDVSGPIANGLGQREVMHRKCTQYPFRIAAFLGSLAGVRVGNFISSTSVSRID
jgi:hypothetical protein